MQKKRIMFLTGTRADYGKIKPLMAAIEGNPDIELYVFVCGMHLLRKFGCTYNEVVNDGYKNIYIAFGLSQSQSAAVQLGDTIRCFAGYVENINPDLIVVHGDRVDALAGAVVGALNNIMVAHIEGGELSGTIDESIRHAITKFAHVHFVCNEEAYNRLLQIGEEDDRIFCIGSPDIDVMMSDSLPSLDIAKKRYNINFEQYGILMYHPVTTEFDVIGDKSKNVVNSVIKSGKNLIVVYPNNDLGSEIIMNEYNRFHDERKYKVYPSLRFEFFLTLLKNADFIIGNSSAGVRESCIYGIPSIDIGTRQAGRYSTDLAMNIQHVNEDEAEILNAISNVDKYRHAAFLYGDGKSAERFSKIIASQKFWNIRIQKHFVDYVL